MPAAEPGSAGGHVDEVAADGGATCLAVGEAGQVADRTTIAALGWRGGDRLTLTAGARVMIARWDPGDMVTVPTRPYTVIPATLRRRCGLRAGAAELAQLIPDVIALPRSVAVKPLSPVTPLRRYCRTWLTFCRQPSLRRIDWLLADRESSPLVALTVVMPNGRDTSGRDSPCRA